MATQEEYAERVKAHQWAFARPYPGFEQAISCLVNGLVAYAEVYRARYLVEVSADVCLGEDWLAIARGMLGLLDGDTGRFHCPALDGLIRATAERAGFTLALKMPKPKGKAAKGKRTTRRT